MGHAAHFIFNVTEINQQEVYIVDMSDASSPLFRTEDIADRIVTAAARHYQLPKHNISADSRASCSWQSAAQFISRHCSPSVQDWVEIGKEAAHKGMSPLCKVVIPALQTRTYFTYVTAWMQAHSAMSRVNISHPSRRTAVIHSSSPESTSNEMAVSCIQSGYMFGLIQQHMPDARLLHIKAEAESTLSCSIQLENRNIIHRILKGSLVSQRLRIAFEEMSDELDSFSAKALSGCDDHSNNKALESLSPREQEVALLLLGGKSRSEIAEILHVALPTVKRHTEKIYRKTGVHSRFQLLNAISAGDESPPRQLPH